MKILAVLYEGGKSAQEEPRLLGTIENKVCPKCLEIVPRLNISSTARNGGLVEREGP